MNEDQLRLIESSLGITLPADYRQTVLDGTYSRKGEDLIIDDLERILKENREYRAAGFHGLAWPPHYYAFGYDDHDNRYFFDLSVTPPQVWFADRETGEPELEAGTFEEWLGYARRYEKMIEEEEAEEKAEEAARLAERAAAEARALEYPQLAGRKAWWQFWR